MVPCYTYLWDLDKLEQKGVGEALKSSIEVAKQATKGDSFIGKGGSHSVILLYYETLLLVLLVIVKGFIG